jgi:hypothetical protein
MARPGPGFAWTVLALVFLDELLAMAAAGVWGAHVAWPLATVMPPVTMLVWFLSASPKARYGGPLVRPVVKVLVFGLASVGLWAAGHLAPAVALLVLSVAVNGLAQLPSVQRVATADLR